MSALQVIRREFNATELELLQKDDGGLYMTSEQIGIALGYKNPAKAISELYNKNIEEMRPLRFEVRLARKPGVAAQLTTIWKKEALYLFSLFASTKTAKEFRLWVTRTCAELESGDKILVDRSELEEYQQSVERLAEHAAGALNSLASIHGSSLARLGHLKRQHPELFGADHGQQLLAFYEEVEAEDVGLLPGDGGDA